LESAGGQKERKILANLEEDHYGRSRKMWNQVRDWQGNRVMEILINV
jgi:hypothetical protein